MKSLRYVCECNYHVLEFRSSHFDTSPLSNCFPLFEYRLIRAIHNGQIDICISFLNLYYCCCYLWNVDDLNFIALSVYLAFRRIVSITTDNSDRIGDALTFCYIQLNPARGKSPLRRIRTASSSVNTIFTV